MASSKILDMPEMGSDPEEIREELGRILQSRHFRNCRRGKRFLEYIVEQTLRGNTDLLKERLLGIVLFDRAADYATGEDSVVRVEANDVRRRLEAYRADSASQSLIVIELPVGSYVPVFRETQPKDAGVVKAAKLSSAADSQCIVVFNEAELAIPEAHDRQPEAPQLYPPRGRPINSKRRWPLFFLIASLAVGFTVLAMAYRWQKAEAASNLPEKLSEAFWEPLLSSRTPVVISLGQTVVYRPSDNLFRHYAESHPGAYASDYERLTHALPLRPTDTLRWGDLDRASNFGFTIGTIRSAIDVGAYLAQQHKTYIVRFGTESSFADLRNFPAVLVGAFNNRWTMNLTSGLHFTFAESSGQTSVREQVPSGRSRTWQIVSSGSILRDYAVITRQIIWETGQPVISVAGIGDGGTAAATELVTKPSELAEVLEKLPAGWEKKNLQIVISTDITEGEAGPPKLVAYYLW